MHDDEIAAVRRVRHEISEECGHDVHKVAAYYRTVGEQLRRCGEFRSEMAPSEDASLVDSAKTA
jgi:hypothetical protein